MNKNDFRNPLIQAGAVLLFVFLLIAIVTNSGPNTAISSISALFSGLISGILFLLALTFAITISIAIIIGLFIAAVSIHSVDKARDMYNGLTAALCSIYDKLTIPRFPAANKAAGPAEATAASIQQDNRVEKALLQKLDNRLSGLESTLGQVQAEQVAAREQLSSLQASVKSLQEDEAAQILSGKVNNLAETYQSLTEKTEALSSQLAERSTQLTALDKKHEEAQAAVQAEIAKLQQKTSVPELVTGILSYIDLPEDREVITQKAEEAVSRGLTYSQIDTFFNSSLEADIYKILSEHPRLTKDFLRSIKKKFA